jgi:ABC-2 type transport system ATP-binding protein
MTIVFSSHVIAELERIADHLVLIRDGEAVLAGGIDDLLSRHRIFSGTAAEAEIIADGLGVVINQGHSLALAPRVIRFDGRPPANGLLEPVTLEDLTYAHLEHSTDSTGANQK